MAGRFFEDLAVGVRVLHQNGRTITETDIILHAGHS